MKVLLEQGTRREHLDTLIRANKGNLSYVWSGDIRRNPYLRENLQFALDEEIIEATFVEYYEAQESGWKIEWLKDPEKVE
jgi:hypothetical protein